MNVCHAISQAVINEIRKRTVVSIGSGLVYDNGYGKVNAVLTRLFGFVLPSKISIDS
jgi:hypothetical protein